MALIPEVCLGSLGRSRDVVLNTRRSLGSVRLPRNRFGCASRPAALSFAPPPGHHSTMKPMSSALKGCMAHVCGESESVPLGDVIAALAESPSGNHISEEVQDRLDTRR